MRKIFIFLCMLISTQLTAWELIKNSNSIKIYSRNVELSAYKEFMGTSVMPASLEKTFGLFMRTRNFPNWMFDCRNARLVHQINSNQRIIWFDAHTPWPLKDRDMYISAETKKSTGKILILLNGKPEYHKPKKGYIRMKKFEGFFLLRNIGKNKTEVTYQAHINPAGQLPRWLINSSISAIPYYTLKRMRNQLE